MEAAPDQTGGLRTPSANVFVCPECGKPYESEFGLSFHRKTEHGVDPFAAATDSRAALAKVRNAVIAGFVSAGLTTLFAVTGFLGFDAWALIDAAVILGLTIGVWNRNRGCAIALFVLWIIEKLYQFVSEPGGLGGLPIAIAFGVLFYQGITGTFAYHRARRAAPPEALA